MSKSHQQFSIDVLHPIRFFDKGVEGQFLVILFPPCFYCACVNDRLDVVLYIPLLSTLVMQGNRAESKRIDDILDIKFGSASDEHTQIRVFCFDKILYEA
jgi:hypothetical protein